MYLSTLYVNIQPPYTGHWNVTQKIITFHFRLQLRNWYICLQYNGKKMFKWWTVYWSSWGWLLLLLSIRSVSYFSWPFKLHYNIYVKHRYHSFIAEFCIFRMERRYVWRKCRWMRKQPLRKWWDVYGYARKLFVRMSNG